MKKKSNQQKQRIEEMEHLLEIVECHLKNLEDGVDNLKSKNKEIAHQIKNLESRKTYNKLRIESMKKLKKNYEKQREYWKLQIKELKFPKGETLQEEVQETNTQKCAPKQEEIQNLKILEVTGVKLEDAVKKNDLMCGNDGRTNRIFSAIISLFALKYPCVADFQGTKCSDFYVVGQFGGRSIALLSCILEDYGIKLENDLVGHVRAEYKSKLTKFRKVKMKNRKSKGTNEGMDEIKNRKILEATGVKLEDAINTSDLRIGNDGRTNRILSAIIARFVREYPYVTDFQGSKCSDFYVVGRFGGRSIALLSCILEDYGIELENDLVDPVRAEYKSKLKKFRVLKLTNRKSKEKKKEE